ncbi:MAG: hypothetical protein EOO63_09915 [Hymenobacter sp.]|nr:MAG: hypothetical protein EOO63_09915 [Hymenobacter sp.]
MKKLFFALLLLSACSKKDEAPAYNDFTPISGQFKITDDGFVRYNKHDTTAVLSDLRLRINTGGTQNVYEFQGRFSARETYNIRFFVDKNRSSPWTGLATESTTYVNGKSGPQGGSSNSGSLSASGNTFSASFDHAGVTGVLRP